MTQKSRANLRKRPWEKRKDVIELNIQPCQTERSPFLKTFFPEGNADIKNWLPRNKELFWRPSTLSDLMSIQKKGIFVSFEHHQNMDLFQGRKKCKKSGEKSLSVSFLAFRNTFGIFLPVGNFKNILCVVLACGKPFSSSIFRGSDTITLFTPFSKGTRNESNGIEIH